MSSEFGRTLRVGVFGQSHGAAIGVSIDGLPAGERIDLAELQAFLDRRKPGKSPLSTARRQMPRPVERSMRFSSAFLIIRCGRPSTLVDTRISSVPALT